MLIFGESENDTRAIRHLIEALCPDIEGKIEVRRRPLVLIANARPENVRPQAEQLAAAVAVDAAVAEVICVFAHKDVDACEPAHVQMANVIEGALAAALRRRGIACRAHAVTPAWETEAWWFLWPDVVAELVLGWQSPSRWRGRDVGRIANAKETLAQELMPTTRRGRRSPRRYQEADSPGIAKLVRDRGVARAPEGRSDSYARFRAAVENCCAIF